MKFSKCLILIMKMIKYNVSSYRYITLMVRNKYYLKSGEIILEYSYPRYLWHKIYNGTLKQEELDKLKFLKDDIIKKQEIEK